MEQMTSKERNALVKKYERLINRIIAQYHRSTKYPYEDITSMALEGFAKAINDYDPSRSSMTFTQYAAYAMRNQILISVQDEMYSVRISAYGREKVGDNWGFVRIDNSESDDEKRASEMMTNTYYTEEYGEGTREDIYNQALTRISQILDERDKQIFFLSFGLGDSDEDMKGKEIAKKLKVSEATVCQRLKAIKKIIREDRNTCDLLRGLM